MQAAKRRIAQIGTILCFIMVAFAITGQGVLAQAGWQWRHWVWGAVTVLFWLGCAGAAALRWKRWRAYAGREPGMAAVAALGLFTLAMLTICIQGLWLGHVRERAIDTRSGPVLQRTVHSYIPRAERCERFTWLVQQRAGIEPDGQRMIQ